ncbi:hypothetical protein NC652_010548 [Populus alba x Populus x berolinensis]|nr:hypothetical protein NC652_010548 [Populus alba x Populus x berolinensis]
MAMDEPVSHTCCLSCLPSICNVFRNLGSSPARKKPVESEESLPTTLTKKERPWVGFSCQDFCTGVSINRYRRCHRWVNHRRIIGTGRLGTVHAAVLPSDQKPVAVKRTHPSLVLSNACLGLISSMLKTLSLAQHPNDPPKAAAAHPHFHFARWRPRGTHVLSPYLTFSRREKMIKNVFTHHTLAGSDGTATRAIPDTNLEMFVCAQSTWNYLSVSSFAAR